MFLGVSEVLSRELLSCKEDKKTLIQLIVIELIRKIKNKERKVGKISFQIGDISKHYCVHLTSKSSNYCYYESEKVKTNLIKKVNKFDVLKWKM